MTATQKPTIAAPEAGALMKAIRLAAKRFDEAAIQARADAERTGDLNIALHVDCYDEWAKETRKMLPLVAALAVQPTPRGESGAREAGFRSAITAIRSWAAGFYDPASQKRLRAVAQDLENNREEILGCTPIPTGEDSGLECVSDPGAVGDMRERRKQVHDAIMWGQREPLLQHLNAAHVLNVALAHPRPILTGEVLREALLPIRAAIEASQWHHIGNERFKRILVAETAIERIDSALAMGGGA